MFSGGSGVFGLVDFRVLVQMLPSILLMAIVGPVFNSAVGIMALQAQTHQKCDIDKEAVKLSFGHIANAICFGFPAASDNVESSIFEDNGGETRASVFVLTAIYFAFLCVPFLYQFAVIIPYPMLGGLYFYLGFDQLYEHLGPDNYQHLQKSEYVMIWVMLIIYMALGQQIIWPFAVGTGWAMIIFIRTATTQRMIFYQGSASSCPSFTVRNFRQQSRLRQQASQTHVVRLNGIISFAQVKQVCDRIEERVLNRGKEICRFVFDFEMTQHIDSSAGQVLDFLFDNLIKRLVPGFQWEEVKKENIESSDLIDKNDKLEAALQHQLRFTRKELDRFNLSDLSYNSYIEVEDKYFKPSIKGCIVISGTLGDTVKESFRKHSLEKIKNQTILFFSTYDHACSYIEDEDLKGLLVSVRSAENILTDTYMTKLKTQVCLAPLLLHARLSTLSASVNVVRCEDVSCKLIGVSLPPIFSRLPHSSTTWRAYRWIQHSKKCLTIRGRPKTSGL